MPILAVLLLWAAIVRADDRCLAVFERVFDTCPAWQCGTNVYNTLNGFSREGVDLKRFDVVFISGAMRSFAGLPPTLTTFDVNTRRGQLNFRSHFFLIENATGLVYDADFQRQPVRLDAYMSRMYGNDQVGALQAKRLGAHQYFDMVNSMGAQSPNRMLPVVNVLRGDTPHWPQTNLQEVLQDFRNRGALN